MGWWSIFGKGDATMLDDLIGVESKVSTAEAYLTLLATRCNELRHEALSQEEYAERKLHIIEDWEQCEEALLRTCKDIQCICSTVTARADPDGVHNIAFKLTNRLEAVLQEGASCVGQMSAARWALPQTAPPSVFMSDAWIVSVSEIERDESQCRFEFTKGESLGRDMLAKRYTAETQRVVYVTTGGAAFEQAMQQSGNDPTALPHHWGGRPCWESQEADLIDVTETMLYPVATFFEGAGNITQVQRIESIRQWSTFAARRELIRGDRSALSNAPVVVSETDLMANPRCRLPDVLDDGVNEKWLFLPCSEAEVALLLEGGVSAIRRQNGLYGAGLYFVESASQVNDVQGGATVCVVLVRVVLGAVSVLLAPSPALKAPPPGSHSVLANGKSLPDQRMRPPASQGAWREHREFILHASDAVYPAYIVRYTKTPASLAFRVSHQ